MPGSRHIRSPGGLPAIVLAVAVLLGYTHPAQAQQTQQASNAAEEPVWWFGLAGAANLNFYAGTTQQLTPQYSTIVPFHKGFGTGPYLAPVVEYRRNPVWGGILQLGYDDRRGRFDEVLCPCDAIADLSAKPAYLSLEPSLRLSPFAGDFHLFAGPRLAFLWAPLHAEKAFEYTVEGSPTVRGDFSAVRRFVYSGQIGAGYDLSWTDWFPNNRNKNGTTRIQLSPFVSYQPHFGQDPRDTDHDVERWALSTVRIGAVLKFGRRKPAGVPADVRFSVQAPATVVAVRRIHEVFPLRNYVYFDGDDLAFSNRYTRLTAQQAALFREEQLQDSFPAAPTGRNLRQMAVYHHILNIVGDRLRRHPGSSITLVGLSPRQGPRLGRARAEDVRHYLMRTYGITGARITVDEREEPAPPLGRSPEELAMLRAENQRVEILSTSREMLLQVGEDDRFMLKPVEIEGEAAGTDSVIFHTVPASRMRTATQRSSSEASSPVPPPSFIWTLTIADDTGGVRRFGPFTRSREALPASTLLGTRSRGTFNAVMTGSHNRNGEGPVTRQASFVLSQRHKGIHETLRYGILFDIDQARAVSSYDRFLATEVAPRITDTSTVFIRGRTDVITDEAYNLKLSRGRAEGVWRSLEAATEVSGRRGVRFLTSWSGEDPAQAPYGNELPEERNYNRTVIIDVVPE
jgi:outer membrane protein OmpA-like peptidoglycan-associated protein